MQRLISLPLELLSAGNDLQSALLGDPDSRLEHAVGGLPRSVDQMSAGNPFLGALLELPIAPGVVAHSIIAANGEGRLQDLEDGVVRYESAHLDRVESELVVRSGHSTHRIPRRSRGDASCANTRNRGHVERSAERASLLAARGDRALGAGPAVRPGRAREVRLQEARARHVGARQVGPLQLRIEEIHAAKVRLAESRTSPVDREQVGVFEVGVAQVGTGQRTHLQVDALELRSAQVRAFENGAVKHRVREIAAGEVGALELREGAVGFGLEFATARRIGAIGGPGARSPDTSPAIQPDRDAEL